MLKGKKCPRPGIMVATKGGLVGTTTGSCGPRNAPEVAVLGLGVGTFKRGELKKLGKRAEVKLKADVARVGPTAPTVAVERKPGDYMPEYPFRVPFPERIEPEFELPGYTDGLKGLGTTTFGPGDHVVHPFLGKAVIERVYSKYKAHWADIRRVRDGEIHRGINVDDLTLTQAAVSGRR